MQDKRGRFQLIQYVFPYSDLVSSVNLTQKILEEYFARMCEEGIQNALQVKDKRGRFQLIQYVFPYSAMVSSVNLMQKILEEYMEYPGKSTELLQACTQYDKYTALHVACVWGHTEIVKALLHTLQ